MFFLILISFSLPVCAQTLVLSLDDAVKRAIEYNLNLQKQQIDISSSAESEKYIWGEIFPAISAGVSLGYGNPLFSGEGFSFNKDGIEYRTSFSISLGFNAGVPYAMKSIRLAHQGNILKYEDAVNQLSIQITKSFFALVAEKNNLLLLEEIFNLAQRQYSRSEISFRNGLVGEIPLMQSRLALENARYNLSAARTAHANNLSEFSAMLGMPADSGMSLSGETNIVKIDADAESLIKEHLTSRPDIVRSKQEIERLKIARTQSVLQNRAPQLNLSLDWRSTDFDPFTDRLSGTASVNIPIDPWIPGTVKSQGISKAKDALEKARIDLSITEEAAKTQIRSLSSLLRGSWDSILIARLSLETARRSYQLTEQGFQNGTVEALALEDVRNNMANARYRLLQTELSYFNMILDLSAALNINWKNFIENFGVTGE